MECTFFYTFHPTIKGYVEEINICDLGRVARCRPLGLRRQHHRKRHQLLSLPQYQNQQAIPLYLKLLSKQGREVQRERRLQRVRGQHLILRFPGLRLVLLHIQIGSIQTHTRQQLRYFPRSNYQLLVPLTSTAGSKDGRSAVRK